MSPVKRWWIIITPRGTQHLAARRQEGDAAKCGLRLRAGWKWYTTMLGVRPVSVRCKRCYS